MKQLFSFLNAMRRQTKRAINCSGVYNTFEDHIWDAYLMNRGEPSIEFTSIVHRNQLASIEEIAFSGMNLANMSEELQELIARFKI